MLPGIAKSGPMPVGFGEGVGCPGAIAVPLTVTGTVTDCPVEALVMTV